jgi:hypothetical protein
MLTSNSAEHTSEVTLEILAPPFQRTSGGLSALSQSFIYSLFAPDWLQSYAEGSAVRDKILNEIRRLAEANGGQPPGRRLFESDTGIPESAWFGVYWPRWGDAVVEAGFTPNAKNKKHDEQFVFTKLAQACRYYGKVPATMELRMYKKIDPKFPNEKTILAGFRGKANLLRRFAEWAKATDGFDDVAAMVATKGIGEAEDAAKREEGLVYLIKSGAHYKIGRSDELERRVKEIRIALPEAASLVHSIRTDDPAGIEAYWHRRFADRRANGEWFKLTNTDVAAFKRRKYQ